MDQVNRSSRVDASQDDFLREEISREEMSPEDAFPVDVSSEEDEASSALASDSLTTFLETPARGEIVAAARQLQPAIIAIDGPAASGKSTVGFELAQTIGYLFFDTGVMYRAVTLAALAQHLDVADGDAVGKLTEGLDLDIVPPGPEVDDGRHATVLVDGEDVTGQLRNADVDQAVSSVSAHPRVRRALSEQQRRIGMRYGRGDAEKPGVVMVGRDIGTVVIPTAPLKIFMGASAAERARRRYNEMRTAGKDVDLGEIRAGIEQRDELDTRRAVSPLKPAEDSVEIDTSHYTPEQVVNHILALLVDVAGRVSPRTL